MKKPVVDLTAIKRVDPVPLQKALETYKKAKSEVASARSRLVALQKEISDFLEGTNADDTECQGTG
jgi:exonuclease VII small subunit